MSAAGQQDGGAGGGGGGGATNAAFLASLPEPLRAADSFKEVKDVADLATRYHGELSRPLLERLPERLRKEPAFKDIKSIEALADSYHNAQKMVGRDPNTLIALPQDPNDDKAMGEIWNKLGRPETPDKYQLPVKRADGREYSADDKAFQKEILPILHEAGLTQSQLAKALPKWDALMDAMSKGANDRQEATFKEAETKFRAELGASYEDQLGLADAAKNHLLKELKIDPAQLNG